MSPAKYLLADNTTTPTGEQHTDCEAEIEPDYRFTLANERTFLSWQRTSLGLLAAAVALAQLVPELTCSRHAPFAWRGGTVPDTLTSGMGLLRWRQPEHAVHRGLSLPRHPNSGYLALRPQTGRDNRADAGNRQGGHDLSQETSVGQPDLDRKSVV